MKKYLVRLAQTVVIEKWFEAETDEDAITEAHKIHLRTDDTEFENGVGAREYDYALVDEYGKDLVYWDN